MSNLRVHRNLAEAVVASLREILGQGHHADRVIERTLKSNPRWGARDRHFIAETTYDIVRWFRLFSELAQVPVNDYWSLLAVWCLRRGYPLPGWDEMQFVSPALIDENEGRALAVRAIRESVPDWLDQRGAGELGPAWDTELAALNQPARVVLRANTLCITRAALQQMLRDDDGIETDQLPDLPDALALRAHRNLFQLRAFREGLFEVQDAGSQRIAPYLDVQPGLRVIDACAGAGGKTLHLAALMQNRGRILALDVEASRLAELKKRARRAGASSLVETRLIDSSKVIKRLAGTADRVLLDVPCSGLGTLRRNPDLKWKLSPESIERVQEVQHELLMRYSQMLKPGGTLVYATCSILPSENAAQVSRFLDEQSGRYMRQAEDTVRPSAGFDGFYMCRLQRQ